MTNPVKRCLVIGSILSAVILTGCVSKRDYEQLEAQNQQLQTQNQQLQQQVATLSSLSCAPDSPPTSVVSEDLVLAASEEGGGGPAGPLVSTEGAIAADWTHAIMAQRFPGMIERGGAGCVVLCAVIPGNVSWTTTTLVAKEKFAAFNPVPAETTGTGDRRWLWEPSDTVRHASAKDVLGKQWPVSFICRQFRNWKTGSTPIVQLVVKYTPDADNLSLLAGTWCGSMPNKRPMKVRWVIVDGARAEHFLLDPPGDAPEYRTIARHLHNVFFTYRPFQNPTTYSTWTWDAPNQRMIVTIQTHLGEAPKTPGRSFVRCEQSTTSASLATSPYIPDSGPPNSGPASALSASAASATSAQPTANDLPTAPGNYRVQLASLKTEADANNAWKLLSNKYKDLLGPLSVHLVKADLGTRGVYYGVQAGPFSDRAAAKDICVKLKAKGQQCLVRPWARAG